MSVLLYRRARRSRERKRLEGGTEFAYDDGILPNPVVLY
jgi:hypothetical protein